MRRGILILTQLAIVFVIILALFMNSNFHVTGFATYESQPDAAAGKDTYLRQNFNTTNYGTNTRILVGKDSSGNDLRGLLEFNVSSLSNNTILSAKLQINVSYASADTNITVVLYRLASSWTESEATWLNATSSQLWSTAGGDYANQIDSIEVSNSSGLYNFTITNLVKGWINGSYANYGIILISSDAATGNRREIDSSDAATSSARPKLTVEYTANAPPTINNVSTNSNTTNLKAVGESANFTIYWEDIEGNNAKAYVCNSSNITFASGCAGKTFCSTSLASTNPITCSYTVSSSENRTTPFFTAVCDSTNCSDVNTSYFYMNHNPAVIVIQPNGSETVNQSQGNYLIKFNVSDADDDFLFAKIYYGATQNSTTYPINLSVNLTDACYDSDSRTSTINNCSYSFDSSGIYGTYYLTIIVNDSYSSANDSSDNSFYIRSIEDSTPPNIIAQWIDSDIYSGKHIQIYANVTDDNNLDSVWTAINTTPETNVTLLNKSAVSGIIYNGTWIATNNGTYKFKVYARDIIGNLNDTELWQEFSIRNPNATVRNISTPSIALPFHTIKVTGELKANDSLRDVYAYLNVPGGFAFLSDYPQNSPMGNFSENEAKNATWYLAAPLTEATYILNITYTDYYSNTWNSSNSNIQVTSAVGGGYELDVSGYPEVQAGDRYYSEAYFKQSGVYSSPDSIKISIYDSLGNLIINSMDMYTKQLGIYNYSYTAPSAPTGQWETRVNATKNSVSYYANKFWKLVSAVFDVRDITIVDTNVSHLNISVIVENKGTVGVDFILNWNLTRVDNNALLDSGAETFFVEASTAQTKYYIPETDYVGQVKITFLGRYSGTEIAGAYEIFSTTSAGGAVIPPSGGGGGGGTGGAITNIPNLGISVDSIVYLAENIPKTVPLKVTNTGQVDLTNVSLSLSGLDELFYHVSPKIIDSLKKGETKNFDIAFSVINMSGEKNITYIVRTSEITRQASGKIVILSILDYLREEIDRLTARISDVGSRTTSSSLKAGLQKCSDIITEIKSQMNNEDFIGAKNNIDVADDCIDKIENQIPGGVILPFNIGYLSWIMIGLLLAIMIIILLIIIYRVATKRRTAKLPKSVERKEFMPHLEMKKKIMSEKSFEDKLKGIEDKLKG